MIRRCGVVFILTGLVLFAAERGLAASREPLVFILTNRATGGFEETLSELRLATQVWHVGSTANPADDTVRFDQRPDLVLLLGDPDLPLTLSARRWEELARFVEAGSGLYGEAIAPATQAEALFGFSFAGVRRPLADERVFVMSRGDPVPEELARYTLLDPFGAVICEGTASARSSVWLAAARVLGTFRVHLGAVGIPRPLPVLVSGPSGRSVLATIAMSRAGAAGWTPRERWRQLSREVLLHLLPPAYREQVASRAISLTAWTEPRRWVQPGEPFIVCATTVVPATVSALLEDGRAVPLRTDSSGRLVSQSLSLPEGNHWLSVTAYGAASAVSQTIALRVEPRSAAYLRAVRHNVAWIRQSGLMPSPDGSSGMGDAVAGDRRVVRAVQRPSVLAETALALLYAGRVTHETATEVLAEGLAGYLLHQPFRDTQAAVAARGVWAVTGPLAPGQAPRWFDPAENALTAFCLLAYGQRAGVEDSSGDHTHTPAEALHSGIDTARLLASVITPVGGLGFDGLNCTRLTTEGRGAIAALPPLSFAPQIAGTAVALFPLAAGVAGDADLLRAGLRSFEHLRRFYPGRFRVSGSETAMAAQVLSVFALWLADTRQHLEEAYDILAYVDDHLSPVGAYRECGNRNRDEFGVPAVFHADGEPICDVAGSASTLLLALWHVALATGDTDVRLLFFRLADFLVRCQIEQPSDPLLDGAWMRAFDYETWQWYGSRQDPENGPYTLLAGPGNARIVLALSLFLLNEGLFHDRAVLPVPGITEQVVAAKARAEPFLPVGNVPPPRPPAIAAVSLDVGVDNVPSASWTTLGGGQAWYYLVYVGRANALRRGEFERVLRADAPPLPLHGLAASFGFYVTAVDAHSQESEPSEVAALP